jgi:hypothetical protein
MNKLFKKKPTPKSEPEVAKANAKTPVTVSKETFDKGVDLVMANKAKAETTPAVVDAPPVAMETKPEDQKGVKPEDQKSAPVVKKKSDTVVKWRAQDGFKPEQVISLLRKDNPKRRGAGERFAKYVDGMSVQAYIDVMKDSMKRTAKQTMGDIRWDVASDFISVK